VAGVQKGCDLKEPFGNPKTWGKDEFTKLAGFANPSLKEVTQMVKNVGKHNEKSHDKQGFPSDMSVAHDMSG
jgi:hypothetical protein